MTVNKIVEAHNQGSLLVYLADLEYPPGAGLAYVSPGKDNPNVNFDIPWCANQADWNANHLLTLCVPAASPQGINQVRFWIWQAGNGSLLYCNDGHMTSGIPIPLGPPPIYNTNLFKLWIAGTSFDTLSFTLATLPD